MGEVIQLFDAESYTDKEIVLKNENDLKQVYLLVKENLNFIIRWNNAGIVYSKLVIASMLLAKIENAELTLSSKTKKGEEK